MITIKKCISVLLSILMVFSLAQICIPVAFASANTAEARNFASISDYARYRNTVNLVVGNVTTGTSRSSPSDRESDYTLLIDGTNGLWARSDNTPTNAVLEVDPSDKTKDDIRDYNLFIALDRFGVCSAQAGKVRWGIQLFPDHSQVARGAVSDDYNTVTVTSNLGYQRTYTLCDTNGNTMASAETGNKSFLRDSTTSTTDVQHGPYYWYLKGPTLLPGEEVKFDVAGICITNPYQSNNQMLIEWCALTIKGVCEHSNGFDTKLAASDYRVADADVEGMGVYNSSCSACGEVGGATFEAYDSQARKFASVSNYSNYRNAIDLKLYGVTSGTSLSHYSDAESAFTQYAQDGSIYLKSSMAPISATLNVDPSSTKTNVSEYNTAIKLNPVHIYSHYNGNYRYGITLQPGHDTTKPRAGITDDCGTVTVVSNLGISRTYTLTDAGGVTKLPAVDNNSFYTDLVAFGTNDQITKSDIWYLSGPVLQPGEEVKFDIIASNLTILAANNYQFLSEWCNFTIKGVCEHSKGFTAEVQSAEHFAAAQSCTSGTRYYRSCPDCGANGTETFAVGSPLGHTWNAGQVITTANCKNVGVSLFTCTVCGSTENRTTPVNPNNHKTVVDDAAVEATCTATGLTAGSHCSACNTIIVAQTETAKTAHEYTVLVSTVPSTCVTLGHKVMKCANCDATTNVPLTEYGSHSPVTVTGTPATCTQTGLTDGVVCEVCGHVITAQQTINKLEHEYTVLVNKVPSTCVVLGHDVMKCENCEATTDVALTEYADHTWNAGEITTAATCCATGTKTFTCTVCDDTRDETIAIDANNHTGGTEVRDAVAEDCGNDGYTGDTYCLGCDTKIADGTVIDATGNHTWNDGEVIAAATCCATGTKKFTCTVCADTKEETIAIDANNHAGGTEVRDAVAEDCGNDGYTGDTYCLGCDTKLADGSVIVATGAHTWNAGEVTKIANCVETGAKKFACTVCGDEKEETIAIDSSNHKTVVNDAAVESTCSQTGLTAGSHCTACNTTIVAQTATAMKPHTETTVQENITNASCTVAGSYDNVVKCTVCHTEISRTHITGETLPHSYTVLVETIPSTCVALGHNVMKCANCEATTNVALTEYGAHSWNAGEVTTPANCVDTGVKTFTCTTCDSTKTEPVAIDANNHKNIVDDAAVESTCTATGLTAGKHCDACAKVIVAQTETAMKAHEYSVHTSTVPSTCVTLGHKVMKCANCTATTNVALTEYGAHTWNAGEVTTPANCVDTGTKTFTCTTCNDTYDETIAINSANHKTVVTVHGTAASCTATGLTDGKICSACNEVVVAQTVTPKKAHEYGEWTVVTEATQETEGLRTRQCAHCDATQEEAIEKLPADDDNNGNKRNCFQWLIDFIKKIIALLETVFKAPFMDK